MARILIIDDDTAVRRMLRQMLELEGYEVVDAPNGSAGIKLYREKPAEIVITDLIMPEKDGVEVIMELRREFPLAKIIAMSGGGFLDADTYLSAARGLGADGTVTKPFNRAEILKAVGELVGK